MKSEVKIYRSKHFFFIEIKYDLKRVEALFLKISTHDQKHYMQH